MNGLQLKTTGYEYVKLLILAGLKRLSDCEYLTETLKGLQQTPALLLL